MCVYAICVEVPTESEKVSDPQSWTHRQLGEPDISSGNELGPVEE